MTAPVTYGESDPLVWIDEPPGLDTTYIENPEVVPALTSQANFDSLLKTALEEVFFYVPPGVWAIFEAYPFFKQHIKRLFLGKVQGSINIDSSIEALDAYLEREMFDSDEGEKLYEMLYALDSLNDLLETIYLRIFSALKP